MFVVTINNLWLKCYLKLCKIVPVEMGSLYILAVALKHRYLIFEKNIKKYYNFLRVIIGSLFSTPTSQTNLSLSVNSIMPAISEGMVVLNDFDLGFCRIIFDSTSNNFILSYLSFIINIVDNILYIFYPHSIKK